MHRPIPDRIVAQVMALAEELAAWCRVSRGQTLAAHEAAVLERVRRVQGKLLEAVVIEATRGLDEQARWGTERCPRCQHGARPWRRRPRTVLTQCGSVTVPLLEYWCGSCRRGWSGVETELAVAPRARMSAGLVTWLTLAGAHGDFRAAARVLAEYTGLEVGAETIRTHAERVGRALADAEDAALVQVEATREAAEPVDPAPGQVVVELDGVMAPYLDGYHELKVGAVGGSADGAVTALSYVAAREGPESFGRRLLAEAARRGALDIVGWTGPVRGRGLARLRPVVVLGDGAPWIWNVAAEHFGDRVEIVDYYPASEHVWSVAHAVFGHGTAEATTWAQTQTHRLLEQGVAPLQQALAALQAPSPDVADLLRRERGYFRTNADRMAYPTFRARGLPIGSGAVESAARHVIQARMKQPGMRWSEPGARAIATLRARLRSGRPLAA